MMMMRFTVLILATITIALRTEIDAQSEECAGGGTGTHSRYLGHENRTKTGRACIPWNRVVSKSPGDPIDAILTALKDNENGQDIKHNYCRNPYVPDEFQEFMTPWCYTEKALNPSIDGDDDNFPSRWDFCDVCHCSDAHCEIAPPFRSHNWTDAEHIQFSGLVNETSRGVACMSWDDEALEAYTDIHHIRAEIRLADGDHIDHNYCRYIKTRGLNPNRPWPQCFVLHDGERAEPELEYCDYLHCGRHDCLENPPNLFGGGGPGDLLPGGGDQLHPDPDDGSNGIGTGPDLPGHGGGGSGDGYDHGDYVDYRDDDDLPTDDPSHPGTVGGRQEGGRNDPGAETDKPSDNGITIAVVIILLIVLVIVVALAAWLVMKRRKDKKQMEPRDGDGAQAAANQAPTSQTINELARGTAEIQLSIARPGQGGGEAFYMTPSVDGSTNRRSGQSRAADYRMREQSEIEETNSQARGASAGGGGGARAMSKKEREMMMQIEMEAAENENPYVAPYDTMPPPYKERDDGRR